MPTTYAIPHMIVFVKFEVHGAIAMLAHSWAPYSTPLHVDGSSIPTCFFLCAVWSSMAPLSLDIATDDIELKWPAVQIRGLCRGP